MGENFATNCPKMPMVYFIGRRKENCSHMEDRYATFVF